MILVEQCLIKARKQIRRVMDFRGFTPAIFSNLSGYSSKLGRINPIHPINRYLTICFNY